jgi:hypothetical protein
MSSTKGLVTSGGATIGVTGGNIWINDANSGAITSSGVTSLSATQIGVVASGSSAVTESGTFNTSPSPTLGANPVADPLASVPAPSVTGPSYGSPVESGSNYAANLSPGIYSGLILSGSGTVNFSTCGIYVFTGSITISGTWTFAGNACTGGTGGGVMLYMTCSGYSSTSTAPCNGSSGAGLVWSGADALQLSAPTSGTYKGLSLFYDRGNTAGLTLSGSQTSVTGTIYAKDSAATISGSYGNVTLNSRIILSNATTSGTPNFSLNFNSSQNYSTSSPPVFSQ